MNLKSIQFESKQSGNKENLSVENRTVFESFGSS